MVSTTSLLVIGILAVASMPIAAMMGLAQFLSGDDLLSLVVAGIECAILAVVATLSLVAWRNRKARAAGTPPQAP